MAGQAAGERVRQAPGMNLFYVESGRIEMLFDAPLGEYDAVVGVVEIFTRTVPEVGAGNDDAPTGPGAFPPCTQEEINVIWTVEMLKEIRHENAGKVGAWQVSRH